MDAYERSMNSVQTMRPGGSGSLGSIDQYGLVSELGGGGFGTVYLARDTVSGVEVAVKGLPPFVKNNREEMDSIRTNFALVSRLHHPNIAAALVLHPAKSVSYASEDARRKLRVLSGDTLMVMEYAPGVTLSQWRKQFPERKVPEEKALEITRQIADALDYAHERKIVHRDVKPANVMIETASDGAVTARVLDFGLAAEIRSSMGRVSQEIHDTSGTRPYMAPEQWLGGRQGPETDQYALAVLFCELVTGEVPFAAVFDTGDPVVMMNVVGREPFVPPSNLPKPMRLALAKALAKKPEERFASCGEFVAALEGSVKVSRGGAEMRREGGAGKIIGVLALLAALGAGGYYGWTRYDAHVKAREAEEARVRQEVYELKGKASQAREKSAKSEWTAWPHFALKAKELEGAFRAGEFAFEKNDYAAARVQFLKVRDSWYWLSSNKVIRIEAMDARQRADASRLAAESAQAMELAGEAYSDASNAFARAELLCDRGDFRTSAEGFSESKRAFEKAMALANAERARLTAERKKADTEAALAAFNARPPRREEGFRLAQTADQDNVEIQFYLGVCYDFGYGVAKDEAEAVRWYRKAAEQGHVLAQCNLGVSYENGQGIAKDVVKAVYWYRKAAEQDNANGQCCLGVMYENGQGVAKDAAEAVRWYRKAAEQGHARAQCNLGLMYEAGQGVAKDEAEAVRWYRKAAEQGHANGQCCLGVMYEFGQGVAKDEAEAVRWYRKAAEQGYARAQCNLGVMYEAGQGVAKDAAEAVRLYRKAAQQGYARAQCNLGVMYDTGRGVAKDEAEAVRWYRKAAERGYARAQFNIGVSYANGQGVAKDEAEAVRWYRKAAEQGMASAQNNLGLMYENGRGIAKDMVEAVRWYRKAAEQGHAGGQYNLGDMYEYGKGVATNLETAKMWYRKAADQGNEAAKKRLAEMQDEIDITTGAAETRYREGLEMVGIDVEGTFRYGPTVRVAPGDNLSDILRNCKDKTTIILSPGEHKGAGSVHMYSKSVRIRGEGEGVVLRNLQACLDGRGDASCLLVMENLTVMDGANNYGAWVDSNARGVVDRCVFRNCGVRISDSGGSGRMVVARTRIEGNYYWGVCCSKGTRGYVSDTTIGGGKDNCIIAFENSRFALRNSLLKGNGNDAAIYARHDGVLFCLENTTLKNWEYGLKTGSKVNGSVLQCQFKNMKKCGIENGGQIDTYKNDFTGTAKRFLGSGVANESSEKLVVNRRMLQ